MTTRTKRHSGLTWLKDGSRRWRKRYRGKYYHFPLNPGETKESSYSRCIQEWNNKKAEIDGLSISPWEVARERVRSRMELLHDGEDTPEARQSYYLMRAALTGLKYAEKEGYPDELLEEDNERSATGFPLIFAPAPKEEDPLRDGPPPWQAEELPASATIAGNVTAFLREKQSEIEEGKIGLGRYDVLRNMLDDFSAYVGDRLLTQVDSTLLQSYRAELLRRINEDGMSASYVNTFIGVAVQYVRWLYVTNRITELPRVLEGKATGLSISGGPNGIKTFEPDELQTLLSRAKLEQRLHYLLMLNCGFTQADVASLLRSEVDLQSRTITRKRSKTSKHESAPVVTYPLWTETYKLLRKQIQTSGKLALLNSEGGPLLTEKLVNGKRTKSDTIGRNYRRFRDGLKAEGVVIKPPLKALRKTAASTLEGHAEYSRYAQYFLGHAPGNVADRYYVKPSQERFTAALKWLRTELKIAKAKELESCT